jgi:hypothetical protein
MFVGWKLYHWRKHPERDHDGDTRVSRSLSSSSSLEELENFDSPKTMTRNRAGGIRTRAVCFLKSCFM